MLKWVIIFDILLSIFLQLKWEWKTNKFHESIKQILKPFYKYIEKLPHKIWLFDFKPIYLFLIIDLMHYFIIKNYFL